jgi:short-subunit dehydrogenase
LRPPARPRCQPDGSATLRLHLKEEAIGRKILITGAGSGLGEGRAIGLARNGHDVMATAQTWPQVTAWRTKSKTLALPAFRVEKLDLLDPYDVARACKWDFDILVNNAGVGEGGPIAEIPLDLVRRNFEVNVFAPLALTQRVVKNWVVGGIHGKVVFVSSMGGLFSPAGSPLMPRRNKRSRRSRRRCKRS